MTTRERLPARPAPDSVDLSSTLELLASLTQYAEAGAVQPHTLSQAAQHALDEHGDRIEVLIAVAKLHLATGERGEASRVLGRAERIAPLDQRVTQLLMEAGVEAASRRAAPASSRRPNALPPVSAPSASPDVDTRVRRLQAPASSADLPPPSAHGPVSSRSTREPTLRSLRALAAALQEQEARAQKESEPAESPPPSSAATVPAPPMRPTVRMARVAPGPERPRWGKPSEGRETLDSRPESEQPEIPRSGRARADALTPSAPIPRAQVRDPSAGTGRVRPAGGKLKVLDVNDERRHLDRYELIGEIAAGGMASVYLARLAGVAGFQRFFAIKRLHPHLADEQEFIDMFLDEARLAAGIHHPNVVPILEVGTSDAGYYLVMDYIEGDTLAGVWNRAAASAGLPRPIALRIVLDTLHGLHAAHELTDANGELVHLVHRDCSPQNILVGVDGSSRLTDFGVARATSRLSTTRTVTVKGKLAYLSPEQATGRALDRRSDLFGMGVILWEALTGHRLFRADSDGATLSRILVEPIPTVTEFAPDIPEKVNGAVMTALSRDPADRFATAGDMADVLEQVIREAGDPNLFVASPREVEIYMRDLFGADIAARREAIRQWTIQAGETASSGPRSRRGGSPAPPGAQETPSPSASEVMSSGVRDVSPSGRYDDSSSSQRDPSNSGVRETAGPASAPRSTPVDPPSSRTEPSAESVVAARPAPAAVTVQEPVRAPQPEARDGATERTPSQPDAAASPPSEGASLARPVLSAAVRPAPQRPMLAIVAAIVLLLLIVVVVLALR